MIMVIRWDALTARWLQTTYANKTYRSTHHAFSMDAETESSWLQKNVITETKKAV